MTQDQITVLLISIIGAIIAVAITVTIIVMRYKKKLKAPIYPLEKYASLDLSHRNDRFIGRTVTRVRISNSSNRNKN